MVTLRLALISSMRSMFLIRPVVASASVYHCNSEIANLRRALAALQQLLERYPTSSILCCDLQEVKSSLKEKQEARSSFFYHRNVARWSQRQDQVNKEFFNQFKRKANAHTSKPLYWPPLDSLSYSQRRAIYLLW